MKIINTPLNDLILLQKDIFEDDRGTFSRAYCRHFLDEHGIVSDFVQANIATNRKKNILRGMHYQVGDHQEDKLIECVDGMILDVVIDLRKGSSTFGEHYSVELELGTSLLVPKGFAHGYLTLTDTCVVIYHVTAAYAPGSERGVRWNDPSFQVDWPVENPLVSEKDSNWPAFMGQ